MTDELMPDDVFTANRQRLIITVGLPGSGKTTAARQWAHGHANRVRVNRDDLTLMMVGELRFTHEHQRLVSAAQFGAVGDLLEAGASVVCDDTNLLQRVRTQFAALAEAYDVPLTIWDLTGVDVEECARRDARRPPAVHGHSLGPVGRYTILSMRDQMDPLPFRYVCPGPAQRGKGPGPAELLHDTQCCELFAKAHPDLRATTGLQVPVAAG